MKDYYISYYLFQYLSLAIACTGFFWWKKFAGYLRLFVVLMFMTFLFNAIQDYFLAIKLSPNHIAIVSIIVEITFLSYIYFLVLNKIGLKKILLSTIGFILLFDFSFWIYDGGKSKSIFIYAVNSAYILCLCLYYFYKLLQHSHRNVVYIPMFWITTGLIIFYSSAIILYITNDYLYIILKDDLISIWTFRNYVSIVSVLSYLYALWLGVREGKLKAAESSSN